MKIEELFYSPVTVDGLEKQRMISDLRIVVPISADVEPNWRITWERLNDLIANSVKEHATRMATMPVGADAGVRFATTASTSSAEIFRDSVLKKLQRSVENINLLNGFDLDLLLIARGDPVLQATESIIISEVFPRSEPGVPCQHFGSRLRLKPTNWSLIPGEENKDDFRLNAIIFKDRADAGGKHGDLCQEFGTFKGLWRVTSRQMIDMFIENVLFSLLLRYMKNRRIIVGGTRYVENEAFKASCYEVRT